MQTSFETGFGGGCSLRLDLKIALEWRAVPTGCLDSTSGGSWTLQNLWKESYRL
jgi:hypothetical protein